MTQAQLSEKTGMSRSAIANYERGNILPGAYALCQFADALDVSVDYLLGRTDKNVR